MANKELCGICLIPGECNCLKKNFGKPVPLKTLTEALNGIKDSPREEFKRELLGEWIPPEDPDFLMLLRNFLIEKRPVFQNMEYDAALIEYGYRYALKNL